MVEDPGARYGERLLRSEETIRAGAAIAREVEAQVRAALDGPFAAVLAGAAQSLAAGQPGEGSALDPAEASRLLSSGVPRRFIATGAALATAHAALAAGDEHRAAGALLCAQESLFPGDPAGAREVTRAAQAALGQLDEMSPAAEAGGLAASGGVEAVQQRVLALADRLDQAFLAAAGSLEAATFGTASWRAATGGLGPASGAARALFGPFAGALVRWAFYVAAALEGIRQDDWVRAGGAIVAARRLVRT